MAGDWIKMRVSLESDPRVVRIGHLLRANQTFMDWLGELKSRPEVTWEVTRIVFSSIVTSALLKTWGMAREHGDRSGDDLVVRYCEPDSINHVVGFPGFAEAMIEVGWLQVGDDQSVVFPRYFREGRSPEERHKEQQRERSRRYREKGGGDPLKWTATRIRVLDRDDRKCGYCGRKATTVDHVIPSCQGGSGDDENLTACCASCNRKKNGRTPEQAGLKLLKSNAESNAESNAQRREEKRREENIPTYLPPSPLPERQEVGRQAGFSWDEVRDRLARLGVVEAVQSIREARFGCNCTPEHAMKLLDYAEANGKGPGAIWFRFKRAVTSLPIESGWVEPAENERVAKAELLAEKKRRDEDEMLATKIIKTMRKAKKPNDEIVAELKRHNLEWPK